MKTATIKAVIIFLSLLYGNTAISGETVQKCIDEKGAITFAERCAPNQQATDTGVAIDSRPEKQKAEDEAHHQKALDDLIDRQSKITPTSVPVVQPNPVSTESIPVETADGDNDSYECLSSTINCVNHNLSNLTPAQKIKILQRPKAVQLPARVKRR